mmetsp:Transcript_30226/g.59880  ORF Transcript_30226/g.59880 Transcript_30226/m.59880 type:complete len:221 (-) Transcript_30226:388-1050(-)
MLSSGPSEAVFSVTSNTSVVDKQVPFVPLPPMTRTLPSSGRKIADAPNRAVSITGPNEEQPRARSRISVGDRLLWVPLLPPMTSTRPSSSITAEQFVRAQLIAGPAVEVPLVRSITSVVDRPDSASKKSSDPPMTRTRLSLSGRTAHPHRPVAMSGPGSQVFWAGSSISVVDRDGMPCPPTTTTVPSSNTVAAQSQRRDCMVGPGEKVSECVSYFSVEAW